MRFDGQEERERLSWGQGVWVGLFLGIVLCLMGYFVYSFLGERGFLSWEREEVSVNSLESRSKLKDIERKISSYYLDREVEGQNLAEGLYQGYVAALGDPYSVYYNEKEYKAMNEETSGQYKGIGIVMQQDEKTSLAKVVRVYKDTPGAKAGILEGDIITKVNKKSVNSKDLSQIALEIRREDGKEVTLTIKRQGSSKEMDFQVTPEPIKIPVVESKLLEPDIAYIQIAEFTELTKEQFDKQFEELKKKGAKKLVIDLRNNPGGLLSSVSALAEEFLNKGDLIVYTKDNKGRRADLKASGEKKIDMPLAVLVNEHSASASEIFAGVVKDYKLGVLVGNKTFGKGIVQQIFDLQDKSALKLTVAKYFTPKGNDIHKIGILPDIKVEQDGKEGQETKEDKVLDKAVEILNEK